jgi:hypothetical protein
MLLTVNRPPASPSHSSKSNNGLSRAPLLYFVVQRGLACVASLPTDASRENPSDWMMSDRHINARPSTPTPAAQFANNCATVVNSAV